MILGCYHDTPFTLSQIRANVVDFDIAIDNSMIS